MYTAADWYNTYGMCVGMVEMDYDDNNPRIRMLNPFGTYPELDRYGRTLSLTQIIVTDAESLAAQYPEYYDQITRSKTSNQTIFSLYLNGSLPR
jgi:hypothetical protein